MAEPWKRVCLLLMLISVACSLPVSRRRKRQIHTPPCDAAEITKMQRCVLERNPPDSRVPVSPISDMYACTAGMNSKDGAELHVVSVFHTRNGTIKLDLKPILGAVEPMKKLRLVLMSHDPVTWRVTNMENANIQSIDLITKNLTYSSVSVNGVPASAFLLHRKRGYYGFLRRMSEHRKLEHYLHQRGFGQITSYSGAVRASERKEHKFHRDQWTLFYGNNYRCHSQWPRDHDICNQRHVGFHKEAGFDDVCGIFVYCSEKLAYRLQCSNHMGWDRQLRQCVDENDALCDAPHPRFIAAQNETDLCLVSETCWSEFPFEYNHTLTACAGGRQLTSLTKYGLYVGVVLCNQTTYSILLSDDLGGRFLPIEDARGHGQDHCEFVGASSIDAQVTLNYQTSVITEGFYRSNYGEIPKRGRIGMGTNLQEGTGRFYPQWYQCYMNIPGKTRVEGAPIRILNYSGDQTVRVLDELTLYCDSNYHGAKTTWMFLKAGREEEHTKELTTSASPGLTFTADGSQLTIESFNTLQHAGTYTCQVSRPKRDAGDVIVKEKFYETKTMSVMPLDVPCYPSLGVSFSGAVQNNMINSDIGEKVEVTCQTQSSNVLKTEWWKDGIRIRTTKKLLIPCFSDKDVGEYVCHVYSSRNSCVDKKAFSLMVRDCGQPQTDSQIIGGKTARVGSAPWMVVLSENNVKRFCEGVLLNKLWVATAAHCLDKGKFLSKLGRDLVLENVNLHLHLGTYDLEDDESDIEVVNVVQNITHPRYNTLTLDNDIALLKLERAVDLGGQIAPVCLHTKEFLTKNLLEPRGGIGKVTGWGQTIANDWKSQSSFLKEIRLPLVPCPLEVSGSSVQPTANMFCTKGAKENEGTCNGDSGGPYVMKHSERWYLLGLVSWGTCETGRTTFTKVPNYVSWIREHISKDTVNSCRG